LAQRGFTDLSLAIDRMFETSDRQETGTKKALHLTMITSYGLSIKGYRGSIQAEVSADDLFA
jgi:hypothetical protein